MSSEAVGCNNDSDCPIEGPIEGPVEGCIEGIEGFEGPACIASSMVLSRCNMSLRLLDVDCASASKLVRPVSGRGVEPGVDGGF